MFGSHEHLAEETFFVSENENDRELYSLQYWAEDAGGGGLWI